MAMMLWDSLMHIDVWAVLNTIRVPTLVLARHGDLINTVEAGAAWAEAIPGAEFEELPPGPHGLLDDALASAVLDFACGTHSDAATERVLSAVLFTDIVGSTELLSGHGDAHWRHELDAHDRLVDSLLLRYGGRRAKHTGDGVFALFDAPLKPLVALSNWYRPWRRAAFMSAWAFTSANASGVATTGAAWPSMSEHVSERWPDPTKCLQVAQCATCQQARACASKALEPIASRVSPRTPRFSVSRPEQAFRFK